MSIVLLLELFFLTKSHPIYSRHFAYLQVELVDVKSSSVVQIQLSDIK